jgi:hypothetical protein
VSYSYQSGSVFTDPTVPVTDFKVRFHAQVFSYYHAFRFLGRSANIVGALPYAVGKFEGKVMDSERQTDRSGLADIRARFAVNLRGGPAMRPREYAEWREKSTLGVSLTAVIPSGQYDPARVINPGSHRWAFKPELGFSRRVGNWSVDLYGGAWLFGTNQSYFPGQSIREQAPVGAGEAHLIRHLTRRFWISADANFWTGGRTTVNDNRNRDYQKNSRVGVTAAVPVNRQQSIKVSYNQGAYIAIGGDYRNLSVAWQYSWLTSR